MFNLFRKNCLYNDSIEPHCAYCVHCKPDNEYQGVCEFRGIVATAGSCRRFAYDALRRKPPKPARIRGRFTAEDFFFEEHETDEPKKSAETETKPVFSDKPLIPDDLSQFADLWADDDEDITPAPVQSADTDSEAEQESADTDSSNETPAEPAPTDSDEQNPKPAQEETTDEA